MSEKVVSLGEVTDILSGFAFNAKHFNKSAGVPVIRIRDVVRGYSDTKYDGTFAPEFVVSDGELLIGMDGEFNIAPWSGGEALLNQRVCRISTKDSSVLDERYLLHFLPKELKQIEDKTPFATVKHLSAKSIRSISIPLPSIHAQRRIANTLDKADTLRRKDQELLQKYDELAQSIFYEMFGDPLGSSDNRVPLSSVVEINPSKREARVTPDTLVSFLPMTCVGEDGSLELSQVRQFKEVSTGFTYFREDDVLFAKITPCMENGKGAIARGLLNGIGFGSTELHVLRPSTRTTSEFIYTLLHLTNVRKEAAKNMTGSGGQQRVPRTFFDSLCITVPPVELQEEFSKRLSIVRALRARALSNIASSTTLFDSLLSKYFV